MTGARVETLLLDTDLHAQSAEQLVTKYRQMEQELEQGSYTQVISTVNEFCKTFVHLINIELGEPLERDTDVEEFTKKTLNGEIAENASSTVREYIPHMLSAAVDTTRPRDTASVGLEDTLTYSDARVGVAISSWLLNELVRLYTTADDLDETTEINLLINELATPVDENPLDELVHSRYEFDEQQLAEAVNQAVHIVREDEEVVKGAQFDSYNRDEEITALLLGRLAAYTQDYSEQLGVEESWIDDRVSFNTANRIQNLSFVFSDSEEGGYYIPGFRVEEAVEFLDK
jgi:hypothetical protein